MFQVNVPIIVTYAPAAAGLRPCDPQSHSRDSDPQGPAFAATFFFKGRCIWPAPTQREIRTGHYFYRLRSHEFSLKFIRRIRTVFRQNISIQIPFFIRIPRIPFKIPFKSVHAVMVCEY
jgi:hypothetical protein